MSKRLACRGEPLVSTDFPHELATVKHCSCGTQFPVKHWLPKMHCPLIRKLWVNWCPLWIADYWCFIMDSRESQRSSSFGCLWSYSASKAQSDSVAKGTVNASATPLALPLRAWVNFCLMATFWNMQISQSNVDPKYFLTNTIGRPNVSRKGSHSQHSTPLRPPSHTGSN